MSGWWNQVTPFTRFLVYAVAFILAFVMAAGIGAVGALVISGDVSPPTGERTRPNEVSPRGEQGKSAQHKEAGADLAQQHSGPARGHTTPQDTETTYVDEVGEIQANSVETFLDSHNRLLRYDALTSSDVEKMQANQAALKGFANQASALSAPQKYKEHKDVLLSAIDELHQATHLAYDLAADPVSATKADVVRYDHLVNEAAASLQQSNEILGKGYKTIEGVQGVSTAQ